MARKRLMPCPLPLQTHTHTQSHIHATTLLGECFQVAHKETFKVFTSCVFHDVRKILINTSNTWIIRLLHRMSDLI